MTPYRLSYHQDPGHGWVEFPVAELKTLGIAGKITGYSYLSRDRKIAYLEEDCDAGLLVEALKARGYHPSFIEVPHGGDCFIRNLPRFVLA